MTSTQPASASFVVTRAKTIVALQAMQKVSPTNPLLSILFKLAHGRTCTHASDSLLPILKKKKLVDLPKEQQGVVYYVIRQSLQQYWCAVTVSNSSIEERRFRVIYH